MSASRIEPAAEVGAQDAAIAIIGSGFCGLAMGIELKRRGVENFVIFEAGQDVGGTWRDNVYPGAEVDTPSHLYSFSRYQYDWTRTHCHQAELLSYMREAAEHFGLTAHLRFGARIVAAMWDEAAQSYRVTDAQGVERRFKIVISAVGFLSRPFIPDWARVSETSIRIVHSALWPSDLDLTGLRVGVVGTGSTAVQIVSEGAKAAGELLVFQRDPNWVIPKNSRAFSPAQRQRYKRRWRQKLSRFRSYVAAEKSKIFGEQRVGASANRALEALARRTIEQAFADRPDLKAKITPNYPFLGKRQVYSDYYYDALKRQNVHVMPAAKAIEGDALIDIEGKRHRLDVLALATGFLSTDYLGGVKITGKDGRDLHETWAGEASAFLGMTAPGFPNFFMLYGPNTNTGPLVTMFEAQARYIAALIQPILRGKQGAVDVLPDVYASYNAWIQRKLAKTTWMSANNYFKTKSGKIVTQWPGPVTLYLVLLRLLRRRSHQYDPPASKG